MSSLVNEKVQQAVGILRGTDTDAWLTLVRETSAQADPVLPLIFGPETLTWQSALLITSDGQRIAIVGRYEADAVRRGGIYETIVPYDRSLRPELAAALATLNPGSSRSIPRRSRLRRWSHSRHVPASAGLSG